MTIVVHCDGVTKGFNTPVGRLEVLKGVDLEVRRGQLAIIEGPSGSGKTTILSIVGGLEIPDSGRCELLGSDLAALDANQLAEYRSNNLGFVFQQFYLLPFLSVEDNVALPLILLGVSRTEAIERAHSLLDAVKMLDFCKMKPMALSGGQQQRVAIARGLVHRPSAMICDEPTSALDLETAIVVIELIKKLARESDTAVLVVTHDPRLFHYADDVYRLDNGKISKI